MWTMSFQMFKLDLEKAEKPEIKCQHLLDHWKSKRVPKKIYFCFIDYAKAFDCVHFSSVQSVMSDSLQPHEPQYARPPCLYPTPRVHPNPCPLCWWCHPTISSSVIPISCPQSFPASGSFQMSQLSTSGGQSIGVSTSTTVPPMNTQD